MDELYYQGTHSGPEIDALLDKVDAGVVPVVGKGINLLDNWYFVGGGSQQGGGQLPVNQRGQTTYATAGTYAYTIDRWCRPQNAALDVQSDSIKITKKSAYGYAFCQKPENFPGGTYTFSVLVKSVTGSWSLRALDGNWNVIAWKTLQSGLTELTFTSASLVGVFLYADAVDTSVELIAAKMELGDAQTLARQVGGAWVLNDPPPNFQTELVKCQRYLRPLRSAYPLTMNFGSTGAWCQIPIEPEMAKTPSIDGIASARLMAGGNDVSATLTDVTYAYGNANTVVVQVTDVSLVSGALYSVGFTSAFANAEL